MTTISYVVQSNFSSSGTWSDVVTKQTLVEADVELETCKFSYRKGNFRVVERTTVVTDKIL